MVKGIYAGSFDPISNGHLDIILRSQRFCSKLFVAIGNNPNKKSLFSEEQKLRMMREVPCIKYSTNNWIEVSSFNGLLIDYAKSIEATILVRGIRSVSDFEYELTLAGVNKILAPEIETVFLPTSPDLAVVSSSMVKEIGRHGGDISRFVPASIAEELRKAF